MLKLLSSEFRLISALSFLELRTRIRSSKYRLFGISAFLIEPLLSILFFLALRGYFRIGRVPGSINPVIFLAVGCITFFMFKNSSLGSLNGLPGGSRARALLSIRRIKAIDILIAKCYTQFYVYGLCLILVILTVSFYYWNLYFHEQV